MLTKASQVEVKLDLNLNLNSSVLDCKFFSVPLGFQICGECAHHMNTLGRMDDLKYVQSFFFREANFRIKRNAEAAGYKARLADGGVDLTKMAEM